VPHSCAGFVQDFTEWQRNEFQVRNQTFEVHGGQRGEQVVLIWAVNGWHRGRRSIGFT